MSCRNPLWGTPQRIADIVESNRQKNNVTGMTSQQEEQSVISQPFIVSIVGPSASGKSQLARRTAAELGEVMACRVPTDTFFIPRAVDQPLPDFLRQPLRCDWSLIAHLIVQPIGTTASTPDADFTGFRRRAECGGLPITIRPVMIVDAMAAVPDADLLVRLDVPADVRRERLCERDARWGTDVLANWDHLILTWQAALEQMLRPDMTLDGEQAVAVNAGKIVEAIRTRLAEHSETGRSAGWGRGSTGLGSDRMG